ncbi:MAG: hypothetical protein ABFC38_07985 [Methanospirillum sp.]
MEPIQKTGSPTRPAGNRDATVCRAGIRILALTLLLALLSIAVPVAAEEYTTYRLKDIRTVYTKDPMPSSPLVRIDGTYADANGGYAKFTLLGDSPKPECTGASQTFSVTWKFDRDVSSLSGPKDAQLCTVMGAIEADGDPNDCISCGDCDDVSLIVWSGLAGPSDASTLPQPYSGDAIVYHYYEPGHKNSWVYKPWAGDTNPGPIGLYSNLNNYRGGGYTLSVKVPRVPQEGGFYIFFQYIYEGMSGDSRTTSPSVSSTSVPSTAATTSPRTQGGGGASRCSPVGTWDWQNGAGTTYMHADGTMEYRGRDGRRFDGVWVADDTSSGSYVLSWIGNGALDALTISDDCNRMDGSNNFYDHVTATRVSNSDTAPSTLRAETTVASTEATTIRTETTTIRTETTTVGARTTTAGGGASTPLSVVTIAGALACACLIVALRRSGK